MRLIHFNNCDISYRTDTKCQRHEMRLISCMPNLCGQDASCDAAQHDGGQPAPDVCSLRGVPHRRHHQHRVSPCMWVYAPPKAKASWYLGALLTFLCPPSLSCKPLSKSYLWNAYFDSVGNNIVFLNHEEHIWYLQFSNAFLSLFTFWWGLLAKTHGWNKSSALTLGC